jgi:hypothetical protein
MCLIKKYIMITYNGIIDIEVMKELRQSPRVETACLYIGEARDIRTHKAY